MEHETEYPSLKPYTSAGRKLESELYHSYDKGLICSARAHSTDDNLGYAYANINKDDYVADHENPDC